MELVEVDSFAVLCRVAMPADTENDQDRSFPRWLVRFPLLHGQGMATHFGLASDINDDGMCILTGAAYRVGAILSLELRIPGGPHHVKALVRYSGKGATGVQFLNLSKKQRLALLDFCIIRQRKQPN